MNYRLLTLTALAGTLALGGCSDDDPAGPVPPAADPIATIAIENGFDELVAALTYVDAELDAGLVELFQNGTDDYAVFAPTDEAFQDLYGLLSTALGVPIDEITDVPATVVYDVLLYHVVDGRSASAALVPDTGERDVTPLLGETFGVRADATIRDGLSGSREDAAIVTADIGASNGIVHAIDAVMVPPSVLAGLTN